MTDSILVVDDDPEVLRVVTRMLQRLEFEVVTAGRPSEALTLLMTGARFVAILTDLELPEMTGLDLLDKLAAEKVPIIAITMSGRYDLSGKTHLRKPFRLEEVRSVLQSAGVLKSG